MLYLTVYGAATHGISRCACSLCRLTWPDRIAADSEPFGPALTRKTLSQYAETFTQPMGLCAWNC